MLPSFVLNEFGALGSCVQIQTNYVTRVLLWRLLLLLCHVLSVSWTGHTVVDSAARAQSSLERGTVVVKLSLTLR